MNVAGWVGYTGIFNTVYHNQTQKKEQKLNLRNILEKANLTKEPWSIIHPLTSRFKGENIKAYFKPRRNRDSSQNIAVYVRVQDRDRRKPTVERLSRRLSEYCKSTW